MTATGESAGQWYALQTYYAQELKVGHYLEKRHLHFFIPMKYTYDPNPEGEPQRHGHPVVHNLIFLERTISDKELQVVLNECPYPIKVYTYPDEQKWQAIPACDIKQLRMLCDSEIIEIRFISQQNKEMKVGKKVKVVHGPMKGITGILTRKNKKYYIVTSFVGVDAIVSVSRWCCEEVKENI